MLKTSNLKAGIFWLDLQ